MVNQEIRDKLQEDTIVFNNPSFDNSIIGMTFDGRAIYDYCSMIKELSVDEGMTEEEADDFINYNTINVLHYCNNKRPLIVDSELFSW